MSRTVGDFRSSNIIDDDVATAMTTRECFPGAVTANSQPTADKPLSLPPDPSWVPTMAGAEGNDYERERLERIARNRAMLASLQVDAAASGVRRAADEPTNGQDERKRGRPKKSSLSAQPPATNTPQRRSSRAVAVSTREKLREAAAEEDAEEYDPWDDDSDVDEENDEGASGSEEGSSGEEEEEEVDRGRKRGGKGRGKGIKRRVAAGRGRGRGTLRKARVDREAEVDEAVARAMRMGVVSASDREEPAREILEREEAELREAIAMSLKETPPRGAPAKEKAAHSVGRPHTSLPDVSVRKLPMQDREKMSLSEEEWTAVFQHISKGRETITASDLLKVSEELGHPAGELDVQTTGGPLVTRLLKRAEELTGSSSSHIRLSQFLLLCEQLY